MRDLLLTAAGLLILILGYRFRAPLVAALQRFDARNRARQMEQIAERQDPLAHFCHTLTLAEEQVEAVSEFETRDERTAQPVTRFLFQGEVFAARADAERARADAVRAIAREFYMDLPRALAAREKSRLGQE